VFKTITGQAKAMLLRDLAAFSDPPPPLTLHDHAQIITAMVCA